MTINFKSILVKRLKVEPSARDVAISMTEFTSVCFKAHAADSNRGLRRRCSRGKRMAPSRRGHDGRSRSARCRETPTALTKSCIKRKSDERAYRVESVA